MSLAEALANEGKQKITAVYLVCIAALLVVALLVGVLKQQNTAASADEEPTLEFLYPDNGFVPSETVVVIVENPTFKLYTLEFSWKAFDSYEEIGSAELSADVYGGRQVFLAPVQWTINSSRQDQLWIYMTEARWRFREGLKEAEKGGECF